MGWKVRLTSLFGGKANMQGKKFLILSLPFVSISGVMVDILIVCFMHLLYKAFRLLNSALVRGSVYSHHHPYLQGVSIMLKSPVSGVRETWAPNLLCPFVAV